MPDESPVAEQQTPTLVPLGIGQRGQKPISGVIVQRQERELLTPVEVDDDTRRPAAEASARVVQQHRAGQRHGYSENW